MGLAGSQQGQRDRGELRTGARKEAAAPLALGLA